MLNNKRGYNAIYLPWTGFGFPNNLQPTAQAQALTFSELGAQLKAAGTNRLRVKLCGWQGPLSTGARSFEPTWGMFNDWGGRLQEAVAMCREYGIGLHVIPFDNQEWQDGWALHAWNEINGGFLDDPRRAISDPQAIAAGKSRIDAIVRLAGDVIDAWEICAEMTNLMRASFWQTNWQGLTRITEEIAVPWVREMAQHIKDRHTAPVGNGQIFGDVNAPRNEVYRVGALDFALINWYDGGADVATKLAWLRECQAYTGKPVYVEQYSPWALGANAPYTREPVDLSWSKAHEWTAACGEYGLVGPMRWPEIKGDFQDWWGVAHPNMAEIAGVTAGMASVADFDDWDGRGENWDSRVRSDGLQEAATWGDGQHVTAFLSWASDGLKNVAIGGLEPGAYAVDVFDWIGGARIETHTAEVAEGEIEIAGLQTIKRRVALYVAPRGAPPPAQDTYTITVQDVQGSVVGTIEMKADETYSLVLESAARNE